MKPVVINITNLIGTMVIIGDKENISTQIEEKVTEALLKAINGVQDCQECNIDKPSPPLTSQ